jgi:uncharacterized protein (TIGR01777 family)
MMKIIILGGTGFVGQYLQSHLANQGHQVQAFGREAFESAFSLSNHLESQDVLIMLAGENVGQRWSTAYKQALVDSRVSTNKILRLALQACKNPPKRILAASAIGIYPENDCSQPLDETCTETGQGFLAEIGRVWEQAIRQLSNDVVIMRFGVVLGKNGGALAKMLTPFKLGLGGPVAGGKQCFSWVHMDDLARSVSFLLSKEDLSGVFNITAPNPVTNNIFGKTLAQKLKRPYLIPLPYWQLKLMFGEGAQVLTHSSAILPSRLVDLGFKFNYQDIDSALESIVNN